MIASEPRRRPRFGPLALALLVTLAGGGTAAADQPEGTPNAAAAQALFDEGKRLMENGQVGAACEKFEESLKLDYGMGTQFKLGDCFERMGRTASAWSSFLEVAARARRQKDGERESIARERAARLEPSLARLRIVVTSPVEGLKITRGDVEVGQAQWGMSVPTDPGDYLVKAEADGMRPFSSGVTVNQSGAVTLTIPELERKPIDAAAVAPGGPIGEDDEGLDPLLVTSWGLLVIGAIGIGVGSVAGIISMSKASDAEAHCNGNVCNAEGVDLRDGALTAGDISTVGFIVGGAAAAGGAALWITVAMGDSEPTTTGSAQIGIGPGHVALRGTFE
jgi:hypothetical protein